MSTRRGTRLIGNVHALAFLFPPLDAMSTKLHHNRYHNQYGPRTARLDMVEPRVWQFGQGLHGTTGRDALHKQISRLAHINQKGSPLVLLHCSYHHVPWAIRGASHLSNGCMNSGIGEYRPEWTVQCVLLPSLFPSAISSQSDAVATHPTPGARARP